MTDISTSVDASDLAPQNTNASPKTAHTRRRQSWLRGHSLFSLFPEITSSKKRRSQSLGCVRPSFDTSNDHSCAAEDLHSYQEQAPSEMNGGRRRSSNQSTISSISSLFAKVARKRTAKRENSIGLQAAPGAMPNIVDCKPYVPFVSAFDDHLIRRRSSQKRHSTSSSSTAIGEYQLQTKPSPPSTSPRIAYVEALQPDKKLELDEIRNDAYPIENDEVEVDRLQAKNDLVKLAFDG
jgi:hypothetical protein